jgi:pimeloyl-ACP methyl ester carboxylesterase
VAGTADSLALDIDGVSLHVRTHGGPESGRPVLLLHGGMAHGGWWDPVGRLLSGEFRPFAPDRRGHGSSDWVDPSRYGWLRDLEDAEALAAEIDPGPWVLVGHSQGGLLAVQVALRARIEVAALVVVDAPFDPRSPRLVRAGRGLRRIPQRRHPTLEAAVKGFQPYPPPHRVPDSRLAELARASFKRGDDGQWTSRFHFKRLQADEGPDHPLDGYVEDLRRLAVPTLVLRAADSRILSEADHAEYVRRIPLGRGEVIADATHSLHVERPQEVARAIGNFARSL